MANNEQISASQTSDESGFEEAPVSMVDVLGDENELEEEANAVLGDSDDKNCTYVSGYVPRQALYSCLTCVKSTDKMSAGVCLACSLACHEGHDLVELYTKRNFCCDCGNSKFGDFRCKLLDTKSELNELNKYNQNYKGLYCSCARPYPDPEDDIEDDMLQCIVCEDWLHGRHLNSQVPEGGEYEEMICAVCMGKCEFLWSYTSYCVGTKSEVKETGSNNNEVPDAGDASVAGTSKGNETIKCRKEALERASEIKRHDGATFWPEKWRQKLCKCSKCMGMYRELDATFLLNEEDSIKAYEERGRAKNSQSQYESGMQALSGMDRHQQVEMLHGFNDMKTELSDYLKRFAENGKVVREEDIRDFFQQLAAKKKKKTSHTPQYFCK